MTTTYQIKEEESTLSVELSGVGEQKDQLLEAFSDCQQGQCSCPTDEYQKLASLEVDSLGGVIRLRLEAKPGEKIDASEIAACLDYTTAEVDKAQRTAALDRKPAKVQF